MTDPLAFVLACLALLATPGPTNTLLATSGASAGVRRSLPLIGAELTGYAVAILTIALLIGPVVRDSPAAAAVLKVSCGAYLLASAVRMWREAGDHLQTSQPISAQRVFVATLLNPKSLVFALVLVPHVADGHVALAAPYLAGLAALILVVGTAWIGVGAAFRAGTRGLVHPGLFRKLGASVLTVFALLLSGSVVMRWMGA